MPNTKIFLCSFGDLRLRESSRRLAAQAKSIGSFEGFKIFSEGDLPRSFRKEFKEKLTSEHRGFGYWVWKPKVIEQALAMIPDGAVLLYLDVGTHLNSNGRDRFHSYLSKFVSSQYYIMATELGEAHLECRWTKGDLLDYFQIRNVPEVTNTPQIQSGVIFLKNGPAARKFIADWLRVYRDSFSLVDDTPSRSPNEPGFEENRHDQSVFSILAKRAGLEKLSVAETYPSCFLPNGELDWNSLRDFPIQIRRDKKPRKVRLGNIVLDHCRRLLTGGVWCR